MKSISIFSIMEINDLIIVFHSKGKTIPHSVVTPLFDEFKDLID